MHVVLYYEDSDMIKNTDELIQYRSIMLPV